MQSFIEELTRYIKSCQSMFYVNSREETRVLETVRRAGWLMAGDIPITDDARNAIVELLQCVGWQPTKELTQARVLSAANAVELLDRLAVVAEKPDLDEQDQVSIANGQKLLRLLLTRAGYRVFTWDAISGFQLVEPVDPAHASLQGDCTKDFVAATATVAHGDATPDRCIVIMKDCHAHLGSEKIEFRRALRNCYEDGRLVQGDQSRHLLFLQPHMQPHDDIRHCLVRLHFPLPDDQQIDAEISRAQASIDDAAKRECDSELRQDLIRSLRGLDTANITTVLSYCLVKFGGFVPELKTDGRTERMPATVRGMRSRQLSTGQGMRIINPDDPEITSVGLLGGYDNVRDLADRVLYCRTKPATEMGLRAPSGFAIAGPPGCGKTACAKLFALWLGVPLVIVNLGAQKGGIVGASEQNMATTIETLKAIGDCVTLFDEWDKQSAGIVGGYSDGNTSASMLSMVLEFASDPARKAFLIFTMNRLHGPVESLRAGRISRFFYTPLPEAVEREEILLIKLTEAGAKPLHQDVVKFAADDKVTEGLSGAELTEMVSEAVTLAVMRCGEKVVTLDDLREARKTVTPVTRLAPDEIKAMEDFKNIAVSVSSAKKKAKPIGQMVGKRSIKIN